MARQQIPTKCGLRVLRWALLTLPVTGVIDPQIHIPQPGSEIYI